MSAKYERPLHVEEEKAKRSAAASQSYASLNRSTGGAAVPTAAPMMAAAYPASAGGSSAVNSHNRVQTHIGTVNVYGTDTSDGHAVVAGARRAETERADRAGRVGHDLSSRDMPQSCRFM
ncbi:hypothetical protein [Caballeronia novacaledonica]|uniref:hypothetical protein n=1 Tax=Caballeronia novacaledonica TaxID=1544861 RepID=UPI0011B2151E|nr:hypothetical protein [Caballeronia novacaledonica]